jgi:AhpD family alkylhydroperoxidase
MELAHLRASQINGCSPCVYSGAISAKKAGESDERLFLPWPPGAKRTSSGPRRERRWPWPNA